MSYVEFRFYLAENFALDIGVASYYILYCFPSSGFHLSSRRFSHLPVLALFPHSKGGSVRHGLHWLWRSGNNLFSFSTFEMVHGVMKTESGPDSRKRTYGGLWYFQFQLNYRSQGKHRVEMVASRISAPDVESSHRGLFSLFALPMFRAAVISGPRGYDPMVNFTISAAFWWSNVRWPEVPVLCFDGDDSSVRKSLADHSIPNNCGQDLAETQKSRGHAHLARTRCSFAN